jgi:hypothetical protein
MLLIPFLILVIIFIGSATVAYQVYTIYIKQGHNPFWLTVGCMLIFVACFAVLSANNYFSFVSEAEPSVN